MKHFLGIDGGGTKTAVVIIDEQLNTIKRKTFGPTSIDTIDLETFKQTFYDFFDHLSFTLDGIYAGIGGILTSHDSAPIIEIFRSFPNVSNSTNVIVENDIMNAFLSGGFKNSGIALIIGTGSVCYGRHDGHSHRASGWGYLEGDLGSAYDLGLHALLNSIQAFDHRIEDTPLYEMLRKTYGLTTTSNIFQHIKDIRLNRTKTASISKLITNEAKKGDITAIQLVNLSCEHHISSLKAVMNSIQLYSTPCVVVGSLGLDEYYYEVLNKTIKKHQIEIRLIKPLESPELAAAKYSLSLS